MIEYLVPICLVGFFCVLGYTLARIITSMYGYQSLIEKPPKPWPIYVEQVPPDPVPKPRPKEEYRRWKNENI